MRRSTNRNMWFASACVFGLMMATATAASAGWVEEQRQELAGTSESAPEKPDPEARKWKIMVVVPESHIRRHIPDPAAETAIVDEFIKAGFRMADRDLSAKYRYDSRTEAALKNGDVVAIKRIFRQAKADILIVGEAFSQGTNAGIGGTVSCRARVEVKAIRRDSGEIIASTGQQQGGLDLTEELAGKTALESAGRAAAKALIKDICRLSGGDCVPIEVILSGVDSATSLGQIEAEIGAIPGVKSVTRDEFDAGIATLEVVVHRDRLADWQTHLESLKSHRLDIVRSTKNSLKVSVAD